MLNLIEQCYLLISWWPSLKIS